MASASPSAASSASPSAASASSSAASSAPHAGIRVAHPLGRESSLYEQMSMYLPPTPEMIEQHADADYIPLCDLTQEKQRRTIIPVEDLATTHLNYTTQNPGVGRDSIFYYKAQSSGMPFVIKFGENFDLRVSSLSMVESTRTHMQMSHPEALQTRSSRFNQSHATAGGRGGGGRGGGGSSENEDRLMLDDRKLSDDDMNMVFAGKSENVIITTWNEAACRDLNRFSDEWCVETVRRFCRDNYGVFSKGESLEQGLPAYIMNVPDLAQRREMIDQFNAPRIDKFMSYPKGRPIGALAPTNEHGEVTRRGVRLRVRVNFQNMIGAHQSEMRSNGKLQPVTTIILKNAQGAFEKYGGASLLRSGYRVVGLYVSDPGVTFQNGQLSHGLTATRIVVQKVEMGAEVTEEDCMFEGMQLPSVQLGHARGAAAAAAGDSAATAAGDDDEYAPAHRPTGSKRTVDHSTEDHDSARRRQEDGDVDL
jgi:hypothetical protein